MQYVLLFLTTFLLAAAFSANAIIGGICLLLFLLNLKWMSRYPVSFAGMFCINGILTALSAAAVIRIIVLIAGTTTFPLVPGILVGVAAIAPVFLWWNVNILGVFRKLSRHRK
ncbi:hypothetical protein ACFQBN_35460 [Cohnella cellulosilytica]